MQTILLVLGVVAIIIIVALVAFDAGKNNYWGVPLPQEKAMDGIYIKSSITSRNRFLVTVTRHDGKVMCLDLESEQKEDAFKLVNHHRQQLK